MKNVMLTGASGFIGRHCIPLLIENGYEVHAFTSRKNAHDDQKVTWHTIDLLDPEQVHTLMKSICPSHLIHFAWYTVPGKYWSALENIQWLQASLNLVQEFSVGGGERMVGAGTCAEQICDMVIVLWISSIKTSHTLLHLKQSFHAIGRRF
jgi:nucleoside-diphosphate-sugar epimerase